MAGVIINQDREVVGHYIEHGNGVRVFLPVTSKFSEDLTELGDRVMDISYSDPAYKSPITIRYTLVTAPLFVLNMILSERGYTAVPVRAAQAMLGPDIDTSRTPIEIREEIEPFFAVYDPETGEIVGILERLKNPDRWNLLDASDEFQEIWDKKAGKPHQYFHAAHGDPSDVIAYSYIPSRSSLVNMKSFLQGEKLSIIPATLALDNMT